MRFRNLLWGSMRAVTSLALMVAVMTANSMCFCWSYQPRTPEGLKKDDSSDCSKMG